MKSCRVVHIVILTLLSLSVSLGQPRAYTLEECETMALKSSYRVRTAQREVEIAGLSKKEAYTHYFPKVSFEAASFTTDNDLVGGDIDLGAFTPDALVGLLPSALNISLMDHSTVAFANVLLPLYAGGEVRHTNDLAGVGIEVAELKQSVARREILLEVNAAFERVVNLREKLEVLTSAEELIATLKHDVTAAIDAGVLLNVDLLRVELEQQRLKGDRLTLESAIRVCTMQLAQLVGETMDGFKISYTPSGEQVPAMPVSSDAYSSVLARDEFKLLSAGVEAAKIEQRITLSKQLPKLGIGAGYMYNDILGSSHNTGLLYATLSVPISQWWGGSYAIKRSRLREQQALLEREQKSELMTLETRQVWSECEEAHSLIIVAKRSVESARENLRVVRSAYSAGTLSMSELLEAQVLYRKSLDQLHDAQSTFRIKSLIYREITK
ncbi:MAG: TolC family protein [Rikenellaceae bacterium]